MKLARVLKVEVTDDSLSIDLEDRRSVSVPIGQSQRDCGLKPKVAVLGYLGTAFEPDPTPKGLRLSGFKY
jgi:hypothetical protein